MNSIKKVLFFLKNKIKYKKLVSFHWTCTIKNGTIFEGANKLYPHTYFDGKMGYGSYIGENSLIIGNIGRFTSIAPYVKCNLGFHPFQSPYATTCPMFFSLRKQNGYSFAQKQMFNEIKPPISIGNDCWIGQQVFIAGGITIGDGAIILAGSIVTKNVPPYAIVGGVPGRIIGYRYDEETINFLLKFKWWNKPTEWLEKNWILLCNIEKLKEESAEVEST